jgi:hypothetical protein
MNALRHLLTMTATVEPWTGDNGYGEREYGTARQVQGRYETGPRLVRSEGGREIVSSARLYFLDETIGVRDRVTLPDGSQPLILAVNSTTSVGGVVVVRVDL